MLTELICALLAIIAICAGAYGLMRDNVYRG